MAKSKSVSEDQGTRIEDQVIEDQVIEEVGVVDITTPTEAEARIHEVMDTSLVYDVNSLFEMRFRDPRDGTICMVRRAFKPRGKLEFYCPEK